MFALLCKHEYVCKKNPEDIVLPTKGVCKSKKYKYKHIKIKLTTTCVFKCLWGMQKVFFRLIHSLCAFIAHSVALTQHDIYYY